MDFLLCLVSLYNNKKKPKSMKYIKVPWDLEINFAYL